MARRMFKDRAAPGHHRTLDLQQSKHAGVFASEKIGLKRFRTPEGYLFCEDVPIARTDEMIYGPGEVPVPVGPDGLIRVTRDGNTLFNPMTLLSYQGKPITNDHPNEDVNPGNWKTHSVGVVLNPRQGEGEQADIMLADFLVTDAQAIADIEAGKVEVSCGYDAMYETLGPGRGLQTDIVGNHVALVERGRCGPRCAIGDRQLEEEDEMRTRDNQTAVPAANETGAAARIRRQFNDMADKAIAEAGAATDNGVNVHVHLGNGAATATADKDKPTTLDAVMATLDGVVKSVAALSKTVTKLSTKGKAADADKKDDDEDDAVQTDDADESDDEGEEEAEKTAKKETKDSKALATGYQSVLAGAEVLVPGMKVPTFDAARPRTVTVDSMCKVRTLALDRFGATAGGAAVLKSLTGGKGYDSLTSDCKATAQLFKSAVAVQTANVNSGMTGGSGQAQRATHDGAQPLQVVHPAAPSISAISERHKAFWKKQGVNT